MNKLLGTSICTVTIDHQFEPGEFNRLFSDVAARMLWAEACRAVRASDEESRNPLISAAWNLRYSNADPLAYPLDWRLKMHKMAKRLRK